MDDKDKDLFTLGESAEGREEVRIKTGGRGGERGFY